MKKTNSKQNFVHKYMNEFNKSTVQEDKKKAKKRGKVKHKGKKFDDD